MNGAAKSIPGSFLLVLWLFFPFRTEASNPPVRVWQEALVVPTYLSGEPEKNPMFYFGRAYQGAKGPVYPYPFLNVLTDRVAEVAYNALYLENAYLRICVLPEVGGRIFEAVDKTNGYHFFYRQHVIKPALIGMLGAWISGGVEWNIPHHHRATTFMPVDWTFAENSDGSKTIWVGELELRHRMRWAVGLTLRPESSALEVTYRISNRTPFAHSILCWANAAVHANENYQVLFPPSTRLAAFHGKNQFSRWPISREFYNGVDYSRGVDVSWWKNHPSPTSFFAFESREDFFAGYDHGRKAGVVFVGDHRDVPGKKLWTWGTGSEGARWEKILTDADGPYLELMFGSFSDNQPDYSWIQPAEVKTVTQFWYPLREIGGVKNANAEAACNLELKEGGEALIGFSTTAAFRRAKVRARSGGREIFEKTIDVGPAEPFVTEILLPPETADKLLSLSLETETGREIIRYKPEKEAEPPLPAPVLPPPDPREMKTNEELYLAGLRLEQFHNPALEPVPYYEEALKRDPEDVRVNTALGRILLQRGLFAAAQAHLRLAVDRLHKNYARPADGEALFCLGLALRFQGDEREALEWFGRASWSFGWTAASGEQSAELASRRGNYKKAKEFLEHSLAVNGSNARARDLQAALLRKLGRLEEAERRARQSLSLDPMDFWARNELGLAKSWQGASEEAARISAELKGLMRDSSQNYLELAADYGRAGLYDDAAAVLSRLTGTKTQVAVDPMVFYDLAYYFHKKGDEQAARRHLEQAIRQPTDCCFPFRLESIEVLRWAAEANPKDGRALFYLGNLLFDWQPEEAVKEWEKAREREETLATVHRDLGLGYARLRNDLAAAVASLEKAVACDPRDPRLYLELDELYDLANFPPQKRLEVLARNHAIVTRRDEALVREIVLLVELGRYDRAIELLRSHHFHVWEGGGEIHGTYVDAHLGRGARFMAERNYERALRDFRAALEYPENLEVGKPASGGRSTEIKYHLGTVLEALGRQPEAKSAFRESAEATIVPSELTYYQGLAWRKLGEEEKARQAFEILIRFSRENLKKAPGLDYFAKFGERESASRRQARFHYLEGLGLLGLAKRAEAKAAFESAISLYPHFARAQRQLSSLR